MNAKSDLLIEELVSAAIAFGREKEPDWQTRIETARCALKAHIEGLEAALTKMKISEHANYLLNEYGRLQFDYAAYCKPYGEALRNEARNNLEEYIAELEAAQRWIPVSERLPELDQDVFAVVEGEIKVGHFYQELDFIENKYENIYFSAGGEGLLVATHWMPLPKLPEVQE